jgi:hypothetical protein
VCFSNVYILMWELFSIGCNHVTLVIAQDSCCHCKGGLNSNIKINFEMGRQRGELVQSLGREVTVFQASLLGTIGFLDFVSRQWGYRVSFSLWIELFLVGPILSIVTAT